MMYRDPELIPLAAGVFALINGKRKFAYVSYTQNLQKRSHSMSHMLLQHDKWLERSEGRRSAASQPYWPIKDMPKHPSDEYTFKVHIEGEITEHEMLAAVMKVQKKYLGKGYKIIAGHRPSSPTVILNGKEITLSEAVKQTKPKIPYLTAYRRLQRGWTVKQSLGIDPPAPRWHKSKQTERRKREVDRQVRL